MLNRGAFSVARLLLATGLVFLAMLSVGVSSAFSALGDVTVDQSVNGGQSTAFTIATSQPNELILVSAGGWPCSGGQSVTVDGSPATLVAAAGGVCSGQNTGGATVFQFVAPTAGTHNIAIGEGGYSFPYFNNFAVSLLNASSSGITSTSTLGPATPSITTAHQNEFVFATATVNTGTSPGTITWSGSPVTPTLLQSNGECCGIDASIAGFTAAAAGTYSASASDTREFGPAFQVTILVAVPSLVQSELDALAAAVIGVGPGTSLADKVALIQGYVDANDTADACGTLGAFIHEVKAQTGKSIPPATAASLIAQAQAIEATLGC